MAYKLTPKTNSIIVRLNDDAQRAGLPRYSELLDFVARCGMIADGRKHGSAEWIAHRAATLLSPLKPGAGKAIMTRESAKGDK